MSRGNNKTVGELNGVNAALFRLNMRLIPIFFGLAIAWATWATNRIFELEAFRQRGDRFTASDAVALKEALQQWHFEDIEWREKHRQNN